MKTTAIVGILSLITGFALGYLQKVRETDEYIHVVQVNGTLIQGKFQTIANEDLKELNDLVFKTHGADRKIIQILVESEIKVKMIVGISNEVKPYPSYRTEIPMIVEKDNEGWSITKILPASVIN